MTLLDISQSAYIFKQQKLIEIITIVAFFAATIFLLLRLKKRLKTTDSRLKEFGQTILILLVIWTIYFTSFLQILTKTFRLEKNGVETIGKTTAWIQTDGSRTVKYTFAIDVAIFTGVADVVYNDKRFQESSVQMESILLFMTMKTQQIL